MTLQQRIEELKNKGFTYQEIADHLAITKKRAQYWGNAEERRRRQQEARRRAARLRAETEQAKAEDRVAKRAEAVRAAAEARAEAERRKHERSLLTKVRARLRMTKKGAEVRGLSCELTEQDVQELLRTSACKRTGIPFTERGDFAVSLDRVDNALGYTQDNVQAVCWAYNRAKGASTDEVVLQMAVALVNKTLVDRNCTLHELTTSVSENAWD